MVINMGLTVLKTVKMYVGGAFIRSESGRTTPFLNNDGKEYARVNQASKKDFRNAVVAAKAGETLWAKATAYNRSQIMYRMAEMTEGKRSEFIEMFTELLGLSTKDAAKDVDGAINTFIYYAGFCDKYQQAIGSVNPVPGSFHNFSTPEQMGVITLVDSDKFSFTKLVDNICAIVVGGNSVITLVSPQCSPIVTTLGEVFATSDLPKGVINLLSADLAELKEVVATHMEVKGISFQNENKETFYEMRSNSVDNMKRVIANSGDTRRSLDLILNFVETKTVWHPIGF